MCRFEECDISLAMSLRCHSLQTRGRKYGGDLWSITEQRLAPIYATN